MAPCLCPPFSPRPLHSGFLAASPAYAAILFFTSPTTTSKDRWYQTEALQAFADFVSPHTAGKNPLIAMSSCTSKSVGITRIIQ